MRMRKVRAEEKPDDFRPEVQDSERPAVSAHTDAGNATKDTCVFS